MKRTERHARYTPYTAESYRIRDITDTRVCTILRWAGRREVGLHGMDGSDGDAVAAAAEAREAGD